MNKQLVKDTLGWGIALWVIGYVLGILLFAFVPSGSIGWIISPIGILITLWVLLRKINKTVVSYYAWLGISWALIAIILDYLLLVKVFNPAGGYYKLDVYFYYVITLFLPVVVGLFKIKNKKQ